MTDIWDDPSAIAWAEDVVENMVPRMAASNVVFSLVSGIGDVKFWVELGASIMMNKPLIAIVLGDAEVPPKLALVAEEIVRLPEGVTPEASSEVAAAMKRVIGDDDEG